MDCLFSLYIVVGGIVICLEKRIIIVAVIDRISIVQANSKKRLLKLIIGGVVARRKHRNNHNQKQNKMWANKLIRLLRRVLLLNCRYKTVGIVGIFIKYQIRYLTVNKIMTFMAV